MQLKGDIRTWQTRLKYFRAIGEFEKASGCINHIDGLERSLAGIDRLLGSNGDEEAS